MHMIKNIACTLLLLIAISASALAQQDSRDSLPCDFVKLLPFKNGKAIVIVKATYRSMFRSPEDLVFKKLAKRKILRYSDYFSPCCDGAALAFVPQNCSTEYYANLRKYIKFDINNFKIGSTFYLTCIFFEGIYNFKNLPFFVITEITATPPANFDVIKKANSN